MRTPHTRCTVGWAGKGAGEGSDKRWKSRLETRPLRSRTHIHTHACIHARAHTHAHYFFSPPHLIHKHDIAHLMGGKEGEGCTTT